MRECKRKRYNGSSYFKLVVAVWRYLIAVVRLDVAERRNINVVNLDVAKRSESIAAIRWGNAVRDIIVVVIIY